jgi:hypothetical protein
MEQLIRKMIRDLRELVDENVPDVGRFDIVYTEFKNNDKGFGVTDWMLKVTQPPKEIEATERKRYLELVAYNVPSPYIAESVICYGNKKDILACLLQEEALVAQIKGKMPRLARDLDDI